MSLALRRSLHSPTGTPGLYRCADGVVFVSNSEGTLEHVDDTHYAEVLSSGRFTAANPRVAVANSTVSSYGRG
jgi:hypothetical protein